MIKQCVAIIYNTIWQNEQNSSTQQTKKYKIKHKTVSVKNYSAWSPVALRDRQRYSCPITPPHSDLPSLVVIILETMFWLFLSRFQYFVNIISQLLLRWLNPWSHFSRPSTLAGLSNGLCLCVCVCLSVCLSVCVGECIVGVLSLNV